MLKIYPYLHDPTPPPPSPSQAKAPDIINYNSTHARQKPISPPPLH